MKNEIRCTNMKIQARRMRTTAPRTRGWCVVLFAFTAIAYMAIAAIPGYGQATTGQIAGQVTDSSGAVLPGAAITATDEEKGVSFTGRADASGNYIVLNMPPGIYSVTATAPGFAEARFTHAVLAIDQKMALDFKLKVGNVTASVEVTEAPPVLQSQTSEVGTVISGDAIVDLPLSGRNFYDLTLLVPGVAQASNHMNAFSLAIRTC